MLKIVTGKVNRAQRVGFYGPEGIGKSSIASRFENPLFLDLESGTDQLDVRRVSGISSWEELLSTVNEVSREPEICKALVIDTADKAEQLCIAHICQKFKQPGLESFGYGRGYTFLAEEWAKLLTALDEVIAKGVNVILIAHARQRKIELPDQTGSFDHWEMKLSKQVAPLVKEWVDMLLFLNFQTYVITTDTNSKKATGGARKMFTSHSPTFDAKNRHNLPEVMDLDYAGIAHLFGNAPSAPVPRKPIDELRSLMERDGITEEQLRQVVAQKGHYDFNVPITEYHEEFVSGWCVRHWQSIVNLITAEKTAQTNEKE